MTFSEIWQILLQGFLPISSVFFISSVVSAFICSIFSKHSLRVTLPIIIAFGFIGGVAGFAVGGSRIPVVGTVLPAMLTFVSGILGYLFSKEHLKEWRLVIPFCIFIYVLNSFAGLFVGSQMRGKSEEYDKQYNEWLLHYEKVELEAEKKEALEGKPEEHDTERPK